MNIDKLIKDYIELKGVSYDDLIQFDESIKSGTLLLDVDYYAHDLKLLKTIKEYDFIKYIDIFKPCDSLVSIKLSEDVRIGRLGFTDKIYKEDYIYSLDLMRLEYPRSISFLMLTQFNKKWFLLR